MASEDGMADRTPTRRSIGTGRRSVHGRPPAARSRPGRSGTLGTLLLAAPVLTVVGCAPPDTPTALRDPLPDSTFAFLRPDTVRDVELHPGVRYRYLWSPRGPWAVHLVQAELSGHCELGLDVLRSEARERGERGRETVAGMVARARQAVLVAVNGDFFTAEGAAVGTEIADGVVRAAAPRPTFAWRRGSGAWMGVAEVGPESLRLGWPVDRPGSGDPAGGRGTEAVGGFPDLIDRGRRVGDLEVAARPSFAAARHPRTAVGHDSEEGRLWLVVVDGRRLPYSAGMTLPELAGLFEALGTDEALNLDGGGSTTLVVGGRPVNRPSDAAGERAVVNALALVRTPEACRLR